MPFTYEFTQYNTPGVAQAGGVKNRWCFTSDVTPFTDENGDTFAPVVIAHDAMSMSQERSSGQVYVKVARDFPIAQLFRTGTPAGTIWLRVRDQDTGAGGGARRVRSVVWSEAEAKLLLSSTNDMLQREGLRVYWQAACGWQLFGQGCGVARDATDVGGAFKYRADGLLASVSADGITLTSTAFATRANGFFEAGLLEVAGQCRMVVSHTGNTVVLLAPIDALTVGAALTVYKGCNRSSGAGGCTDFANTVNFQGCPNIKKNNIFVNGLENV